MILADGSSQFRIEQNNFSQPNKQDFLFCYHEGKIGLNTEDQVPVVEDFLKTEMYCFGSIDNHKCFLCDHSIKLDKYNFVNLRIGCALLPNDFQYAAAIGHHICCWRNLNKFCGKCGAEMFDSTDECARICSSCNNIVYPRISPCVIVLVTHNEKMLLARSPHFPPGVLSTLAGFVSVGETVEQAVVREVKEEVGIEVNNLKYICSQPWPFPDSLMLGFTAEYVSGELKIDEKEIEFAGWFGKDNLPELPCKTSISCYLINGFINS